MREYIKEHYPDESLETCEENIRDFFKFMHKRHLIWDRRHVKKLPRDKWTNDPILTKTKYTNIYRQLDRGSLWCIENILKTTHNLNDLIFKLTVYRLCNRIETFEEVGVPEFDSFNFIYFHDAVEAIANTGQSVMTSAHLTCPSPKGLYKYEGYLLAVIDTFNKNKEVTNKVKNAKDAKAVHTALTIPYCVGGFTGYEVYCDLCYLKSIPFTTNDFTNVGPGAIQGIRLLYPNTKGYKNIYQRLIQLHREQSDWFAKLGIRFRYTNYLEPVRNSLSLRCIEHSLCEYSKYWLQKKGLGKVRMIFNQNTHPVKITEDGLSVTPLLKKKCKPLKKSKDNILAKFKNFDKQEIVEYLKSIRGSK